MRYFNLFLALLAIVSSGYLSWRHTQPELNGHWHIIQDGSPANPGIATLDINWKNMVQADKLKVGGSSIGGPLDRFRRHIFLFPTCLSLKLQLSWKGDTLVLTDISPYWNGEVDVLKALRVAKGKCTAEEDHFLPSKFRISLPTVDSDEFTIPYQANSLGLILVPSQKGMNERIVSHYGKNLNLEDLVEEAEMVDIKNPRNAPVTAVSIFANESVVDLRIDEILKVFSQEDKGRKIYRVKKKINKDGLLQFLWTEF
jgi:hypothetical protein